MTRRLWLLIAVAATALCAEDFTGKVVAITDADTIKIMHADVAERIRLRGIVCPESSRRSAQGQSNSPAISRSARPSRCAS